ncbi:Ubiquitin carboxyl-terminal hydrolase 39-like protein [Drosera capensis]
MAAESLIRRREDEEEGLDGDERDSKRHRVEESASSQVAEFENPLLTLATYDDEDEGENGGTIARGEDGGGQEDGVNGSGGEVENVNERIVDEKNGHGGGLGDGANGHGGVVKNDNEGGGENGNGGGLENGEEEGEVMAGGAGGAVDDDDDEEEEGGGGAERVGGKHIRHVEVRRDCPYLDTVNRQVLDFDFEKFCSVSLSNLNVYACLVCGKYFQGRGHKSHAYTHSLEAGHHVYINLRTEKVYCLPDGYEINDPSLDDIRHVLNPRFNREQVEQIDKIKLWSRALDGSDYLPGMVGLNNIKDTDFVNVTIQSLMRVTPLRNFFLIPENYQHCKSPLVHRFGELTRKIWHARNFKGQVSPHEFLQAVMKASKKRFRIGAQSDPVEFMSWLLNTLHADIRTKKNYSVIYQCFQGELEVVKEIQRKALPAKEENGEDIDGESEKGNITREASKMPFLMLGLDLPPPPLFKDVMEKNIIPQVQLFNIFKKFDGETVTEVVRPHIARMRYRVTRLPPYLILHMRRFTKNNFFMEKNPTLVNFPAKNLELKDYIPLPTPKENEKLRSKYDLIANIVHDGKPGEGSYRAFVQRKSEEQWYEMQDLHVSETLPQMVALSEAYMQIYEQQQQQQ